MADTPTDVVDVRIELPLPIDVSVTLMRIIALTWPGTVIKDGKGDWRSDNRLVLSIPESERHKSPKKAEKYAKAKAHLDGWADTVLNDLGPSGVGFGLPKYVADLLIGMCQEQFKQFPAAENYLESTVYDRENCTSYVVICARSEKQTPHELRRQAEAERDDALAEVERLKVEHHEFVARLGFSDFPKGRTRQALEDVSHGPVDEAITGDWREECMNALSELASIQDRCAELEGERDQWKALWEANTGVAGEAMRERDDALREVERLRAALDDRNIITDHFFLPVAGHPDDDECTHRSDGSDSTYCGQPESDHAWSDR